MLKVSIQLSVLGKTLTFVTGAEALPVWYITPTHLEQSQQKCAM